MFAATASSAEFAPDLPPAIRAQVLQLAESSKRRGDATVEFIVGGGRDHLPSTPEVRDLTPMRNATKVELTPRKRTSKSEDAVGEFVQTMHAAKATSAGLDLLSLLEQAGEVPSTGPIIVISSGLSTVDPVDLRQLGWAKPVASVVKDLASRHLLPHSLKGRDVLFVGLGATAAGQARPETPQQTYLSQLWVQVCEASGAARCDTTAAGTTPLPAVSTVAVPVVAVPRSTTWGGAELPAGPCQRVWRLPGVMFSPDSAVLTPTADAALTAVVRDIRVHKATIDKIAGYVADTHAAGGGYGLSLRRARAVAARLHSLGIPLQDIHRVVGLGATDPIAPNWNTDGTFNEARAALNRRVEISLTDTTCHAN